MKKNQAQFKFKISIHQKALRNWVTVHLKTEYKTFWLESIFLVIYMNKTNNQEILKNSNKSTRKNMIHLDLKRTKYLKMSQK